MRNAAWIQTIRRFSRVMDGGCTVRDRNIAPVTIHSIQHLNTALPQTVYMEFHSNVMPIMHITCVYIFLD